MESSCGLGAKRVSMLGSPIEVEAEAIRWSIHTMSGFGCRQVIIETDSIAKMTNGEETPWPKFQPILQDISNSLALNRAYKVELFNRSDNKVADRMLSSLLEADKSLYDLIWLTKSSC